MYIWEWNSVFELNIRLHGWQYWSSKQRFSLWLNNWAPSNWGSTMLHSCLQEWFVLNGPVVEDLGLRIIIWWRRQNQINLGASSYEDDPVVIYDHDEEVICADIRSHDSILASMDIQGTIYIRYIKNLSDAETILYSITSIPKEVDYYAKILFNHEKKGDEKNFLFLLTIRWSLWIYKVDRWAQKLFEVS